MKIVVGSKNLTKLQAVQEAIALYPALFPTPEITGIEVTIDTYGHPKNLDQTIAGAIDRAKQAYIDCDYSIGLEGGLMSVPETKTGFMEVGACAVYDGKEIYLGLSPAFEWPKNVTELILKGEADASQAFNQLGLTHHEKIGAMKGGAIGFLTNGKLTRENFTKYSIIMSLIQIEHKELF